MKSIEHLSGVIELTHYLYMRQIEGNLGWMLPIRKGTYFEGGKSIPFVVPSVHCPLFIIKAPFKILDYTFIQEIFDDIKGSANLNDTKKAYSKFLSRLMDLALENINLYQEIKSKEETSKNYGLCRITIGNNWSRQFFRKTKNPDEENDEDVLSFDRGPTIQHIGNYELASFNDALIDFVNTNINDGRNVEKPGVKSFSWTGTPDELRKLFNGLVENRFFAGTLNYNDFERAFSVELTGCKAIKLNVSNLLFAYFFNQLYACKFINTKEWINVIIKNNLFLNKQGNYFKSGDLYTAKSETDGKDLNPRGYEKIDEILKTLRMLKA